MKFEVGDRVRNHSGEYTVTRIDKKERGIEYSVKNDTNDVWNMTSFFEGSPGVELIRKATKLEKMLLGLDTTQQKE